MHWLLLVFTPDATFSAKISCDSLMLGAYYGVSGPCEKAFTSLRLSLDDDLGLSAKAVGWQILILG